MSTTSIIVEMLIIGFFTSLWIALFYLRYTLSAADIQLESFKSLTSLIGTWSTPMLFIAAAVFYQLGLIMNTVSYRAISFLAKKKQEKARNSMVPDKQFETVKTVVWQKGSADVVKYIESCLIFVRLSRAGIINFLLIAIALFTFGWTFAIPGLISLLIGIGCIPLWQSNYDLYYTRMKFAYQVITESEQASAAGETAGK